MRFSELSILKSNRRHARKSMIAAEKRLLQASEIYAFEKKRVDELTQKIYDLEIEKLNND